MCHLVGIMEGGRNALIGKRLSGRPMWRYDDNIIMELKEIGVNMRNLVDSAKDRGYWKVLVGAASNLCVP